MPRDQRLDPEVEALWDDFHNYVNVSSEQLRSWLLTAGSGTQAFPPEARDATSERGRAILAVLRKRKVDLTPADVDVMRDTVMEIQELLASPPRAGAADQGWRHALLGLGHDVLRERELATEPGAPQYRRHPG